MWVAMLKSGVHATLVGILLALFIPLKSHRDPSNSMLRNFESDLHTVVAFFILPVFAFANAGISFSAISLDSVTHPVSLGIVLGLFAGKLIGVFGLCLIAIKLNLTTLPQGMDIQRLLGLSALCGIGFTMSMFIGSLAFEETGVNLLFDERLGIIVGSLFSGILGYLILRNSFHKST